MAVRLSALRAGRALLPRKVIYHKVSTEIISLNIFKVQYTLDIKRVSRYSVNTHVIINIYVILEFLLVCIQYSCGIRI
jgi:hypothetical protein